MKWSPSTKIGAGVAVAAMAVAVLVWWCAQPGGPQVTWYFDCPNEAGVTITRAQTVNGKVVFDTTSDIPLSGPITDIPEYHDCQRFVRVRGDAIRYDSVYAIFAASSLPLLPASPSPEGEPVATIFTPGGTYDELGIKPGFNCLFLMAQSGKWTARMVYRKEDRDCSKGHISATDIAQGKPLEVRPSRDSRFGPEDYPAVARWDWDSKRSEQYIGIRCGPAWCEVGKQDFNTSSPYGSAPPTFKPVAGLATTSVSHSDRAWQIKGWYDEQRLAPAATGTPQPGLVHGVLIPNPALDDLQRRDAAGNFTGILPRFNLNWGHVAVAMLDGDYKGGFKKGSNDIYMCRGPSPASCHVPTSVKPCPVDPTESTMHWWAKVVPSTGDTSWACVTRVDHLAALNAWNAAHSPKARFVGTARWRFLPNDESSWISCPSGCCTKN